MLIMKKQRNLSYHISILVFLFVISMVMVTSSPFQMLLDVNPSFKSTLSYKLANAADDKENSADAQEVEQEDVKDEESAQEFDQTSFEGLGGKDDVADEQEDVKDEESAQEFDQTSFEGFGGNDDVADEQEDVKDEESAQEIDQTAVEGLGGKDEAEEADDEDKTDTDKEAEDAEEVE